MKINCNAHKRIKVQIFQYLYTNIDQEKHFTVYYTFKNETCIFQNIGVQFDEQFLIKYVRI
jgi:hypothetical protein